MKCRVIGFTRRGCGYAKRIETALKKEGHDCEAFGKGAEAPFWGVTVVEESLRTWTEEAFARADSLVFIGAAGIAVRAIAPFVKSKAEDPAVLCMDEQGRHVISLLSGHLGGANALTERIADICRAVPVITTATDINGKFSVDDFARRENLCLGSMALAKKVSADLVEGKTVGLYSDFEIQGELPDGLSREQKGGLGVCISADDRFYPYPETLHLIPRISVLGIGCKKGTSAAQIEALVQKVMAQNRLSMYSIGRAASIDLKREEKGLLEFCRKYEIPFTAYSAEELREVCCEDGFSGSDFVRQVTGVDNVCERSALRASGQTRLLQRKIAEKGVTVAIALETYRVRF